MLMIINITINKNDKNKFAFLFKKAVFLSTPFLEEPIFSFVKH
ncbi:hypothetical protein BB2000_1768 [Proteus mirabilis BB2000]|nr:hypothetical protein BB2000_1768 [Proteus mirabilis BB2000]